MRVLAAPHGIALAHITRPLEVAKVLRARGHEVVFTCSAAYASLIEQAGFRNLPIVTEDPAKALARMREGKRYRDDAQMLDAYVRDELRIIEETRSDLVLGDMRPTLGISTEIARLPYVAILNACFTKYYAAHHEPPETWPMTRWLGRTLSRIVVPRIQMMGLKVMAAPFRKYRREHGLLPIETVLDVMESPFLNLIVELPQFAPLREDRPANVRYVGPILWQPDAPAPAWLTALPPERKLVYVTLGSTGERGGTLAKILEALQPLDVEVAFTGNAGQGGLPPNVHAMTLAPGLDLARRAAVVICHAGSGTIYQAFAGGAPVLCLPTFIEQEFHADRAVALGAGLKLAPRRVTAGAVREACRTILGAASFRVRARELAEEISKPEWDAPRKAADLIESFVSEHGGARSAAPGMP